MEFPSHPHFIAPKVNAETIGVPQTPEDRERVLEQIAEARIAWISAIETLKAKVPEEEVDKGDHSLSYHVLLNTWLGQLNELDELEGLVKEEMSFDAN